MQIINKLFIFILGGFIFGSIVAYAIESKYSAEDISYKETNVNQSLNELYDKVPKQFVVSHYLHTVSYATSISSIDTLLRRDIWDLTNVSKIEFKNITFASGTLMFELCTEDDTCETVYNKSAPRGNGTKIASIELTTYDSSKHKKLRIKFLPLKNDYNNEFLSNLEFTYN